jgi:hypothetical protein
MDIDMRETAAITAGPHAVAHLGGYTRVVRGIDRFTHLPTREPAAVIWVSDRHPMDGFHTEVVPLDQITTLPGRCS